MARSNWPHKRKKLEQAKWAKHGVLPGNTRLSVPSIVPEAVCRHCDPVDKGNVEDNFDENGYAIPKAVVEGSRAALRTEYSQRRQPRNSTRTIFRFMDLPPEIRNRIYEFTMCRPKQPVCVPGHLLRPSNQLPHTTQTVLRKCTAEITCLPCQIHDLLGTGSFGLSRSCKQLHFETSLIPYTVNTFRLHNLYYLQEFLGIIGERGRQSLTSLNFAWKLPEEEADVLKAYTSAKMLYTSLGECHSLVELSVEIDVVNMLSWRGNGRKRTQMLNYINEVPSIALVFTLRGLKKISIGWTVCEGLMGMEEWARSLAGHWRLPRGVNSVQAVAIDSEVEDAEDGNWRYVQWEAGDYSTTVEA